MRARHSAPPVLADCFSNCLIKEDAPRAQPSLLAFHMKSRAGQSKQSSTLHCIICIFKQLVLHGRGATFVFLRAEKDGDGDGKHLGSLVSPFRGKTNKKGESCMTMNDRYIWMHAPIYYCCIEEQHGGLKV